MPTPVPTLATGAGAVVRPAVSGTVGAFTSRRVPASSVSCP